jgi:hypothetical protein
VLSSRRSLNKSPATTAATKEEDGIERKITLATEGFTTTKFCELVLKDRDRLSKENALTISDYIIAMKREINPRLSYKVASLVIMIGNVIYH